MSGTMIRVGLGVVLGSVNASPWPLPLWLAIAYGVLILAFGFCLWTEPKPQRWTLWRYGQHDDWHVGRPLNPDVAEIVEVIPVSETPR